MCHSGKSRYIMQPFVVSRWHVKQQTGSNYMKLSIFNAIFTVSTWLNKIIVLLLSST